MEIENLKEYFNIQKRKFSDGDKYYNELGPKALNDLANLFKYLEEKNFFHGKSKWQFSGKLLNRLWLEYKHKNFNFLPLSVSVVFDKNYCIELSLEIHVDDLKYEKVQFFKRYNEAITQLYKHPNTESEFIIKVVDKNKLSERNKICFELQLKDYEQGIINKKLDLLVELYYEVISNEEIWRKDEYYYVIKNKNQRSIIEAEGNVLKENGKYILLKNSSIKLTPADSYFKSPGYKSYDKSRTETKINEKGIVIENKVCDCLAEIGTIIAFQNSNGQFLKSCYNDEQIGSEKTTLDNAEVNDSFDTVNNNEVEENMDEKNKSTNVISNNRKEGAVNEIYYGIPGCGKSHLVDKIYNKNDFKTERVVFYPDYSYADFVGQCMPTKDENGNQVFDFVSGPFTRILKDAWLNPSKNYALIIEEINRGNAAAIFGDLFQLLDRTDAENKEKNICKGESKYPITNEQIYNYLLLEDNNKNEQDTEYIKVVLKEKNKVKIPSNLSIIATMNTTDQNLYVLDSAFKRRWQMIRVANNFTKDGDEVKEEKDKYFNNLYLPFGRDLLWKDFAQNVNKKLRGSDNIFGAEDKQLGAWFAGNDCLIYDEKHEIKDLKNDEELKKKLTNTDKQKAFADKAIAYLWNDAIPQNHREDIFNDKIKCLEDIYNGNAVKSLKDIFSEKVLNDETITGEKQQEENNE